MGFEIRIDPPIDRDSSIELSSMVKWNKFIVLVPAFKNKTNTCPLILIDTNLVNRSIIDPILPISTSEILFDQSTFNRFRDSIPNYSSNAFDGIEGTVLIGNNIYFSIKSGNPNCNIYLCISYFVAQARCTNRYYCRNLFAYYHLVNYCISRNNQKATDSRLKASIIDNAYGWYCK